MKNHIKNQDQFDISIFTYAMFNVMNTCCCCCKDSFFFKARKKKLDAYEAMNDRYNTETDILSVIRSIRISKFLAKAQLRKN